MKELIADDHSLIKEQVILGNGAVEILYQLAQAINPDKVLIVEPTFSEYELASRAVGASIFNLKLLAEDDFELTDEKTKELIAKIADIDLLFLCNPNNPTGKIISIDQLQQILNKTKIENTFVVIDEAFIDFLENKKKLTATKFLDSFDNILILRSLTKIYGVPGLRLGYALTNKKLVKQIENSRDPWSVNYFAQLACQKVFSEARKEQSYIQKTLIKLNQEKVYLYKNLNNLQGFKAYYPTANYIFIDIKEANLSSLELTEILAAEGVMIRNCDNYYGLDDNYIRVAVKTREENKILLDKLSKLV